VVRNRERAVRAQTKIIATHSQILADQVAQAQADAAVVPFLRLNQPFP